MTLKVILSLMLIFFFTPVTLWAENQEAEDIFGDCLDAAGFSHYKTLNCQLDEYSREEDRLTLVYKALEKDLMPWRHSYLKKAQKAWEKYHESYDDFLHSAGPVHEIGTATVEFFLLIRINDLRSQISRLERANSPSGLFWEPSLFSADCQDCLAVVGDAQPEIIKCLEVEYEDVQKRLADIFQNVQNILPERRRESFLNFDGAWREFDLTFRRFLEVPREDEDSELNKASWRAESALRQSTRIWAIWAELIRYQ